MKNVYKTGLWACFLFCAASRAGAQQFTIKESETDLSGPKHELLLCPGGDYLAITHHYNDDKDPLTVSRFDPKSLSQRYTNNIQELSQQHYRAAMYSAGRPYILCSTKDGAISRYAINDQNGTLAGSPAALFDLTGKEEDAKFSSGSSADKNYHYLAVREHVKKEKGEVLEGVVLDKQMNKLCSFSYITPEDRDDFQHVDFAQADNGTLSLIYGIGVKAKKDDYTPNLYTLVQVDTKGKTTATPLTGLPVGDLRNISWTAIGGQLQFTGLISTEKKSGFTVFVSGSYDPATKKIAGLRQKEIKSLLTQSGDIVKDIDKKGIPADASVLKTITLSDGSKELVLEVNSDRFYQSYYGTYSNQPQFSPSGQRIGIAPNTPSYSMIYHNRGNVYILKLDKTNDPVWMNVISKKQQEGDVVIAIGVATITDDKDDTHVFFFDNKKNTEPASASPTQVTGTEYKRNVFACVTVSRDGKMSKEIIEQEDPEFRLMLEEAVSEGNKELICMAIKTKRAFAEEHLFNHASFRLTRIEKKK